MVSCIDVAVSVTLRYYLPFDQTIYYTGSDPLYRGREPCCGVLPVTKMVIPRMLSTIYEVRVSSLVDECFDH
jgi:hypothetical protein